MKETLSANRWRKRVGWLVPLGVLSMLAVGCPRAYTAHPDLNLHVTTVDRAPVDAQVTLFYWSHPHRVLDDTRVFSVEDGMLALEKTYEYERTHPMCLHGVPEHHVTLCAHAPGYRDLMIPNPSGFLSIQLTQGHSAGVCSPERYQRGETYWNVSVGERIPRVDISSEAFDIKPLSP